MSLWRNNVRFDVIMALSLRSVPVGPPFRVPPNFIFPSPFPPSPSLSPSPPPLPPPDPLKTRNAKITSLWRKNIRFDVIKALSLRLVPVGPPSRPPPHFRFLLRPSPSLPFPSLPSLPPPSPLPPLPLPPPPTSGHNLRPPSCARWAPFSGHPPPPPISDSPSALPPHPHPHPHPHPLHPPSPPSLSPSSSSSSSSSPSWPPVDTRRKNNVIMT